jgi:hypothetical protein
VAAVVLHGISVGISRPGQRTVAPGGIGSTPIGVAQRSQALARGVNVDNVCILPEGNARDQKGRNLSESYGISIHDPGAVLLTGRL